MLNKIIWFITLMCCSFLLKAQSSTNGRLNLKSNFSAPILAAYQESSKTKIEDFYQYLNLLSDPVHSESLKNEIAENLYQLFKSNDVLVPDLTSENQKLVPISSLISLVKTASSLKFELVQIEDQQLLLDGWQINYTIEVSNRDKKYKLNLTQTIYLQKSLKQFGNEQKEVWQMYLGAIK